MAQVASPPSSQDRLDRFYRYCQHEITDLHDQISNLENHGTTNGEQGSAFDHCSASIARLSESVREASSYLPAHDQRTYSEAVQALTEELQKARSSLAPRQKFSFKKKNPSAISLRDAAELAAQRRLRGPGYYASSNESSSSFATTPAELPSPLPDLVTGRPTASAEPSPVSTSTNIDTHSAVEPSIRKPSFSQSNAIKISNHNDQHFILPSTASHATSSGTLSNLSKCVIDMSSPTATAQPFAGLTLKNISDSLLICGHVNGPAHITGVKNSIIVVACRQFRMHESKNVHVYLWCGSRPIIEDCKDIQFAEMPKRYVPENDLSTQNMWNEVDDFKWLKAEPSPHWSVLEPENQIEDDIWTNVVPGKAGYGPSDILKAARLPAGP